MVLYVYKLKYLFFGYNKLFVNVLFEKVVVEFRRLIFFISFIYYVSINWYLIF